MSWHLLRCLLKCQVLGPDLHSWFIVSGKKHRGGKESPGWSLAAHRAEQTPSSLRGRHISEVQSKAFHPSHQVLCCHHYPGDQTLLRPVVTRTLETIASVLIPGIWPRPVCALSGRALQGAPGSPWKTQILGLLRVSSPVAPSGAKASVQRRSSRGEGGSQAQTAAPENGAKVLLGLCPGNHMAFILGWNFRACH